MGAGEAGIPPARAWQRVIDDNDPTATPLPTEVASAPHEGQQPRGSELRRRSLPLRGRTTGACLFGGAGTLVALPLWA